jgi:hypothetical protein
MRMLIWGIVGLSGLGFAVQMIDVHGSTNDRAAIRRAVRAPLADLKRRDARALCEDFTPSVAAHLVGGASESCEQSVSALFRVARNAPEYVPPTDRSARRLAVSAVHWRGARATVVSSYRAEASTRRKLRLELLGRRWRIATPTRLEMRSDCSDHPFGASGCVYAMSVRFAAG